MEKNMVLLLGLLFTICCHGQKIKPYKYNKIDSLMVYSDGKIVVYRDSVGKTKSDTFYFYKMKKDISILRVETVIVDYSKKIKPKINLP